MSVLRKDTSGLVPKNTLYTMLDGITENPSRNCPSGFIYAENLQLLADGFDRPRTAADTAIYAENQHTETGSRTGAPRKAKACGPCITADALRSILDRHAVDRTLSDPEGFIKTEDMRKIADGLARHTIDRYGRVCLWA